MKKKRKDIVYINNQESKNPTPSWTIRQNIEQSKQIILEDKLRNRRK